MQKYIGPCLFSGSGLPVGDTCDARASTSKYRLANTTSMNELQKEKKMLRITMLHHMHMCEERFCNACVLHLQLFFVLNLIDFCYRSLIGPLPVPYRSLIGPLSALYRSLIGPLSVTYRSLIGPYRSLIGPLSVPYRSLHWRPYRCTYRCTYRSLIGPSSAPHRSQVGPLSVPYRSRYRSRCRAYVASIRRSSGLTEGLNHLSQAS